MHSANKDLKKMDIPRMLGIMIICGVPAIIGGGITYHFFHNWMAVWIWELIVVFGGAATAYRVGSQSSAKS